MHKGQPHVLDVPFEQWVWCAGVLHDPAEGDPSHTLCWQLPQEGHRHCGISDCLPEPHVQAEYDW